MLLPLFRHDSGVPDDNIAECSIAIWIPGQDDYHKYLHQSERTSAPDLDGLQGGQEGGSEPPGMCE